MDEDLLPARMVNEFVYCPRLFYLEWVEGRFADSDDTRVGQQVHRRVDTEAGAAPLPDEGELTAARSVMLSSQELGVIAKIDVIEGIDGSVVPIDYKKGEPQPDGTPWPSDEVQACIQAMVLRNNGYCCDRTELYYATPRRRVSIDLTPERLAWVTDTVAAARNVAQQSSAPLPLVNSPKCVRCSLVGLCLPDETNALLARQEQQPRRLVPRDPDQRPVYVTEPGSFVGVRSARLEVTRDKEKIGSFRLIDVQQVVVFGRVQVSTQALHECFAREIPVMWMSTGGWLQGFAIGQLSGYVEVRRRQTVAHAQGGNGLAQRMIAGKIANCRTLLRRNARTDVAATVAALKRLSVDARECDNFAGLLGIEGTAARLYFAEFPKMLSAACAEIAAQFSVLGRNRRPPPDPVNALLSFCYSMLTKDLVAVIVGVGLDPYLGVYHRSRYGRPALALDLAEEFRPLIADSVVVGVLNNGEIGPHDFIRRAGAVALTSQGRKTVLKAYERRLETKIRHPVFGYQISYRRVLDVQARLLAAVLVGELPEYVPMVTR
ncbi:CRISPR-associated endonuclease Cas4/Cas1 [Mycobacterium canetti]|uniref:CRISPR-associated endonuclease Cas4/Cas1 n=1 Tax=Mycobacterium canetti TaxID=78331 RepID=UPI0002A5BA9E|nr:CRISPR-associated endonuclease Cas4/Cas1 [Mycobacterium canetti]MBC9076755.1 CRISPR-associated endonuclease Cas4/Cas1 [Mycobacterium canetti]CCK56863.1 Putative CRISPR-associated deoxyribonuclease/nuclease Cas1/Cas4 [Mycobacterium canettii CIPT 140070008]